MFRSRFLKSLLLVLLLAVTICSEFADAQAVLDHDAIGLRGFHGATSRVRRSFEPEPEAGNLLRQVLSAAGLPGMEDRIVIRASDHTANAEAASETKDGASTDYIFYNTNFMKEITARAGNYWSLVAIFAHEVGHHVRRHTVVPGRDHEFELEADYQAGFILRRMGSSIDEAQAVYHTFPLAETKTHPDRRRRLETVARGWQEGGQMALAPRGDRGSARCPAGQSRRPDGTCATLDPTTPLPRQQAAPLTRAETVSIKPAQTFRECPHCPELVALAPGSLTDIGDPSRKLRIDKRLAFGRYEVTFAEWDACVADGGCKHVPDDAGSGRGARPVVNVSWHDATNEYLPWLSRKVGRAYRLPSESEWVFAAAGGTVTNFAWGDEIVRGLANCANCGSPWDNRQSAPVGSFAPNAFGLFDVHGNVWEWVQDCVAGNYPKLRLDASVATGEAGCFRGLRGASFNDDSSMMQFTSRGRNRSTLRAKGVGFRVVRPLE